MTLLENGFFSELDQSKLDNILRMRTFKADNQAIVLYPDVLVKTRDGKELIVFELDSKLQLTPINVDKIHTYELSEYNEDLTHESFNNLDVMEVSYINQQQFKAFLLGVVDEFNRELKWKRSELKKVTITELIDFYEKTNKCKVGILAEMGK